jgi:hypothetical protein
LAEHPAPADAVLGGLFKPYMEETLSLSLKNLSFFFDDSVRESASMCVISGPLKACDHAD